MAASKSIRRFWISGLKIVVSIIVGIAAANAFAAQVTLAWNPNKESNLAGYKIHYGTTSGSYNVHLDVRNITAYTVTGLTAGRSYYFAVSAYNTAGNESGYSNQVSYYVPAANLAPLSPATPSGPSSALLSAAVTFSTSATDPNGDSLQYRYDWGGGTVGNWGAASQSHRWAAAGRYAVKAQARNRLGAESAWSPAKTVAIQAVSAGVIPSPDTNGDGIPDRQDAFPDDPKAWEDSNGTSIGDNTEDGAEQSRLAPNAPLLTSPIKDSVVNGMAELKTEPFNSPLAGATHAKTRWQVFRDEDDACLLDIQSGTALTRLTVPKLVLDEGTPFYWRAQFIDSNGVGSEWSDYEHFSTKTTETDLNGNGIPDAQEVASKTDLDRDGVPDSQQTTIKSVKMEGTQVQTGITIRESPTAIAIEAVESEDPRQPDLYATNKPENMPFGILNIKIAVAKPGDQAVVKLYFLEPVPASGKWYEYDAGAESWIDFSAYTEFASDRRSASITLRDGGPGDADGVANGIIIDPGGIGLADDGPDDGSGPNSGNSGGAGCFIGSLDVPGISESTLSAIGLFGLFTLLGVFRRNLKK